MSQPAHEAPAAALVEIDRLYSTNLPRQLMEISQALQRRLRDVSAEHGHVGLKMSFATVMSHAGFGDVRLSDIAAVYGMSKQAVSQIARELAELGYIRLLPDHEDGRARIIELTPRGRALIADSVSSIEVVEREMATLIGEERLATFKSIVAELAEQLGRRAAAAPELRAVTPESPAQD